MTDVDILLPRKNFDVQIKESFSEGITGIFGPNGSGKTSLLHCISGLARPAKGKISIEGNVVFVADKGIHVPVEKRSIGYVFQEGRLFPHMNVEKNLLYGVKKHVISKITFDEVVELLNLRHLLKSKPAQISGGERQRTALGRSLLSTPNILLLDEPFSAVDTHLRSQIIPFIIRIQQKVKIPILVVSHDLPDLLKLTNTLFLIRDGQCIGHGEYYNLLKNRDVSELFGDCTLVNTLDMEVKQNTEQNGLTLLEYKKGEKTVLVKCEKSKENYEVGSRIKIFIHADDIALSGEFINGISIQNQLQGEVTDLIERGSTLLCVADVGFRLVVEITAESQKRLKISKGSTIWCLFKSVAIDVVG
ncbi:MAG: molybdenum ABC transporter ATP-binding protein [Bacteroidales bacterium]|nr:molybdenum ABC transporter ATP-binding protein [Bacteroidales bacterium]